ncbi:MAG: hypothetical protein ABIR21_06520 [Chthoniobacterales bacterium]
MENKPKAWRKRAIVWLILPIVYLWARRHEAAILRGGVPLDAQGLADARRAGVRDAERVRILVVDGVPPRLRFGLRALAARWQWGPSTTAGMSLGYGIFLRADQQHRPELLRHELVHTAQYERLGYRPFLRAYLSECLTAGYPLGALETEARDLSA